MKEYTRLDRRRLYENPWVIVDAYRVVHPTGAHGEHVLIVTPAAVGAVIFDGEDVLLTRQPRFGAQQEAIEIVKGGSNEGEPPIDAVQRETREELGIVARSWMSIGLVWEIPSIMHSPVQLFIARDLRFVEREPEHVESIALERMPFREALAAAVDGRITDAVTIAALVRAAATIGHSIP